MDQRAKSSQFNWSKQQRMLRVTEFVWREKRFVYLKFKVITGYSDVACASARIPKCVLVYVTGKACVESRLASYSVQMSEGLRDM